MSKIDNSHIYVGRWAVCMIGVIGKVVKAEQRINGIFCDGIALDGKRWTAHNPRLLHKKYDSQFEKQAKANAL